MKNLVLKLQKTADIIADCISRPINEEYSVILCQRHTYDEPEATKKYVEKFTLSNDELLDIAWTNTVKKKKPVLDFLRGGEKKNPFSIKDRLPGGLFSLTNELEYFGAIVLFYPGIQEKLSELFGGSYYAIPYSVHEFLLVAEKDMNEGIEKLIKEMDESRSPYERLSTTVLFYDGYFKRFCIPMKGETNGKIY